MLYGLDEAIRNATDQIPTATPGQPTSSGLPIGGEPQSPLPASVNVFSETGQKIDSDLRARIRVPKNYLKTSTLGSSMAELSNGIIFPYTPQITFDYKTDYSAISTVHTNYTQFFYKNSSVGSINITARFTVQNSREAEVYLATKHLLASLMKMPFGKDAGAGSPPPVCRLDAYGPYMLKNVPIVITNFRLDLPADVDYYDTSRANTQQLSQELGLSPEELGYDSNTSAYANFVPVISNFIIGCQPLYSRREMTDFNIQNFIGDYFNNTKYL